MEYISTRGNNGKVSAAQAIKQGLADDGGLFMPESIPQLTVFSMEKLIGMTYPQRAASIMSMYLTDYTYEELLADCEKAYAPDRFIGGACPISELGKDLRILELWHGPTCAFKDMALQIMPRLLSRALDKTGEERTAYILVATSGDTGKAALDGYADVNKTRITVFYPLDGVSRIQKLQMATQSGENVDVCAIHGNFDDAQTGVKKIFGDKEAQKELNDKGFFFSSANSINWGRLVPQVVYYVSAYCELVKKGDIKLGEKVNVCVPTGNFGNIFAAYLAKQMGLPLAKLVCASNVNNILTDFLRTGTYDRNRAFHTTMSPSLDILISSNLERLLYLLGGSEKTAAYMKQLNETGCYTIDEELKKRIDDSFVGYYCDEKGTSETIRSSFETYHYLHDTHTAVAVKAAEDYIRETGDHRRMIVASTASPYKFASSVYTALTDKTLDDEFECLEQVSAISGTEIPRPLAELSQKAVRFNQAVDAASMKNYVLGGIGR